MEIQIIEDINNNLLNRREVVFKATYENATPSRKSIIDKLSALMNSKQGLVIIDNMKTEFGKRESIGYAKIYESPERVKEIERTHIIERNVATTAQIDSQKTSEQSETK
ncbi:MAG: 30S ribosomal protein S24e [Methanotrichaceae archaeon]|nr:30S ribosomal protein S24e [Methanotrichaceae archaeon]